jgi:hypothetical protein
MLCEWLMTVPICSCVVVSQSESDELAEAMMTVSLHANATHFGSVSP